MSMFGMDDDKKSLLIQEIYQRPLIWKVSHPQYSDYSARSDAFHQIAQTLSDDESTFTADMVKMTWKHIMDYYKYLKRLKQRSYLAGTPIPPSKWKFYDMLHFLKHHNPFSRRIKPEKIDIDAQQYSSNASSVTDGFGLSSSYAESGSRRRSSNGVYLKRARSSGSHISRKRERRSDARTILKLNGFVKEEKDVKPEVQFITRGGRKSIKRRLSLSPSPTPRAPKKSQKAVNTSLSTSKPVTTDSIGSFSSLNSIDESLSAFTQRMASRLMTIKMTSADLYATICQEVDHSLQTIENSLYNSSSREPS